MLVQKFEVNRQKIEVGILKSRSSLSCPSPRLCLFASTKSCLPFVLGRWGVFEALLK